MTTIFSSALERTEKLDVLLTIYIAAIVCAELLGSKIFTWWGVNASVAIFVFPLTYTINDIVYEVEGKKRAQHFMRCGFMALIMMFAFLLLALNLPPAGRFQGVHPAYVQVFSTSLRIVAASLTAFWISERLDIYVFAKLKARLGRHKLWLRNNVSNVLSQLIDTTLFMFLAFYMPGNAGFVVSLIVPYWLLKSLFSAVHTPFTYWGVNWLKGK